jgi:hypothetical protein
MQDNAITCLLPSGAVTWGHYNGSICSTVDILPFPLGLHRDASQLDNMHAVGSVLESLTRGKFWASNSGQRRPGDQGSRELQNIEARWKIGVTKRQIAGVFKEI